MLDDRYSVMSYNSLSVCIINLKSPLLLTGLNRLPALSTSFLLKGFHVPYAGTEIDVDK